MCKQTEWLNSAPEVQHDWLLLQIEPTFCGSFQAFGRQPRLKCGQDENHIKLRKAWTNFLESLAWVQNVKTGIQVWSWTVSDGLCYPQISSCHRPIGFCLLLADQDSWGGQELLMYTTKKQQIVVKIVNHWRPVFVSRSKSESVQIMAEICGFNENVFSPCAGLPSITGWWQWQSLRSLLAWQWTCQGASTGVFDLKCATVSGQFWPGLTMLQQLAPLFAVTDDFQFYNRTVGLHSQVAEQSLKLFCLAF